MAFYQCGIDTRNVDYLFNSGDVSNLTSGFTGYVSTNDSRCAITIGDTLYIKCGMSRGAAIDTDNLIDVTDYDAIVVEIDDYSEDAEGSGYNGLLGLIDSHTTPTAPAGGAATNITGVNEYAYKTSFGIGSNSAILSLINVTGKYYIRFSLHQSNAGGNQYLTIKKMYLVKFTDKMVGSSGVNTRYITNYIVPPQSVSGLNLTLEEDYESLIIQLIAGHVESTSINAFTYNGNVISGWTSVKRDNSYISTIVLNDCKKGDILVGGSVAWVYMIIGIKKEVN